jgi:hypothetical protein
LKTGKYKMKRETYLQLAKPKADHHFEQIEKGKARTNVKEKKKKKETYLQLAKPKADHLLLFLSLSLGPGFSMCVSATAIQSWLGAIEIKFESVNQGLGAESGLLLQYCDLGLSFNWDEEARVVVQAIEATGEMS